MRGAIIRRIDDLGRVVIPKEIRRTMRWNEGKGVEISIGSPCTAHTGMSVNCRR
jgi:AbrB family looped-hinge helix DNA binding protein